MKNLILVIFLSCFVHFTNAQVTAGELVGIHNITTLEMNAIDSAISGSVVYNTDTDKELFRVQGSSNYQTSSRTIIITLTQNNLLSIYSKRFKGSGSLRTVADAISISIKKLD